MSNNKTEETIEEREYTIKNELIYLKYLYKYIFYQKNMHLVEFLLFHFVVGFIPLFIVIFKVINKCEDIQLGFWGDGTLAIYCFTIICSIGYYYFTNSNNSTKNNPSRSIIWVGSIIYLIITIIVYIDAQLNFNRSWDDICIINCISILLFLLGCFASLGIHFSTKYGYDEIMNFRKNMMVRERGKKIKDKNKSEGIDL